MKNNCLIIYWVFGPTFKDRIIKNLHDFESYKYFDVLILTDDVEYFNFKNENIFIKNVYEYTKLYPEFDEYEILPNEKRDETKYKNELIDFLNRGIKFPCNIQRYGLLYENIGNYEYIIIADCDMIPTHTDEDFDNFQNYLKNIMPMNSISTTRAYYTWDSEVNLNLLKKYNDELQKNIEVSYPIESFDSLYKVFKFENLEKINEFFYVWNYILLDSFRNKTHLIGGSWNILPEQILAFVYKLCGIRVNTESIHYLSVNKIQSFTYIEDRFWDNVANIDIDTNANTKKEFIKINYDKLKEFYINRGQKFDY